MNKHPQIVLTSPATEMTTHHNREFLGFGTCSPTPPFPHWLTRFLFYPTVENSDGVSKYAPYGLRKVEAALLENGFTEDQVAVIHPDYLDKYVGPETKAVGISTMDPLGLGPVSATFSTLLNGKPATAFEFQRMMNKRCFKKYHPKIILGGPGAWQFQTVKDIQRRFGISTVVIGEADEVAPEIFRRTLLGDELPPFIYAKPAVGDRIPTIKRPSVNGLVEISRGCGRNCQFCIPTMRPKRDFPVGKILEEATVNVKGGCLSICLHAEDVLLYGSGAEHGFKPVEDRVLNLFKRNVEVLGGATYLGISHVSLPAVASSPDLVKDISHLLGVGGSKTPFLGVQVGLETGSVRLIRKYMAGKPLPYKPEDWPEVVKAALGVMEDNDWIPALTLMIGLPGENTSDIEETIDLLDDLRCYRSLIVPLFFVPAEEMILHSNNTLKREAITPEHEQLLLTCLNHSFHWASRVKDAYLGRDVPPTFRIAFSTFMRLIGLKVARVTSMR
ncbi:MAG: B12-binding domain-containing radical SAM protein [Candidatus Bathyarchaeia archaeon]